MDKEYLIDKNWLLRSVASVPYKRIKKKPAASNVTKQSINMRYTANLLTSKLSRVFLPCEIVLYFSSIVICLSLFLPIISTEEF